LVVFFFFVRAGVGDAFVRAGVGSAFVTADRGAVTPADVTAVRVGVNVDVTPADATAVVADERARVAC
jgi:hypothetical protein